MTIIIGNTYKLKSGIEGKVVKYVGFDKDFGKYYELDNGIGFYEADIDKEDYFNRCLKQNFEDAFKED